MGSTPEPASLGSLHSSLKNGTRRLRYKRKEGRQEGRAETRPGAFDTVSMRLCSGLLLPPAIRVPGSGTLLLVVGRIWIRRDLRDIREGLYASHCRKLADCEFSGLSRGRARRRGWRIFRPGSRGSREVCLDR